MGDELPVEEIVVSEQALLVGRLLATIGAAPLIKEWRTRYVVKLMLGGGGHVVIWLTRIPPDTVASVFHDTLDEIRELEGTLRRMGFDVSLKPYKEVRTVVVCVFLEALD